MNYFPLCKYLFRCNFGPVGTEFNSDFDESSAVDDGCDDRIGFEAVVRPGDHMVRHGLHVQGALS